MLHLVAAAEDHEVAPELPEGVSETVAEQMRDAYLHLPEHEREAGLDAIAREHGITDPEMVAAVREHARVRAEQLDKAVERERVRFAAETNSAYVDDERVRELVGQVSPEVMAELSRQHPELLAQVREGLDDDAEIVDFALDLAAQLDEAAPGRRAALRTELRVEHKQAELAKVFEEGSGGRERIKQLMTDCSPEEYARLDEAFGGQLAAKLAASSEPDGWDIARVVVTGLAIIATGGLAGPMLLWAYEIALVAGKTGQLTEELSELSGLDALTPATSDPEMLAILGRARQAQAGGDYPIRADLDAKLSALEGELTSWWTNDTVVMEIFADLNPKELAELKRRYEADHGAGSLVERLRETVQGEDLAAAVGALRNADDAAAGIDRGQTMLEDCRDMVRRERAAELEKDPKHKGK